MGTLLNDALRDGFRIALLETRQDHAYGATAFQCKLFDGGREVQRLRFIPSSPNDTIPAAQLFTQLCRVIAAPHLLVAYGVGWQRLLHSLFGARAGVFRILDLYATAIAMRPTLPARAPAARILQAFSVQHSERDALLFSDAVEQLLWRVLEEADKSGFSWQNLLNHAASARTRPDFSNCVFNESALETLPEQPGVYAMYDARGVLLYVGMSANLRRRLSEYFSPVLRLPPKIARIRNQIHRFSYQCAGSDLEALLLEHHLITTEIPAINVQRHVAEGRSRYPDPLLAIMIVVRSSRPRCADAFVFDAQHPAYQITFNPDTRQPPAALRKVISHFTRGAGAPKCSRSLCNWGDAGREICRRYFGRNRTRVHWCALGERFWERKGWFLVQTMANSVLRDDSIPAEFRED